MATKLTLRLDEKLIARAKARAEATGKSVSRMVADYFALLEPDAGRPSLSPRVRALKGVLRGTGVERQDHRRHLEEKYR